MGSDGHSFSSIPNCKSGTAGIGAAPAAADRARPHKPGPAGRKKMPRLAEEGLGAVGGKRARNNLRSQLEDLIGIEPGRV